MRTDLADLVFSLRREYPTTDRKIDLSHRIEVPDDTGKIELCLANRDSIDNPYVRLVHSGNKRRLTADHETLSQVIRLCTDRADTQGYACWIGSDTLNTDNLEYASRIVQVREDLLWRRSGDPFGHFVFDRAQVAYLTSPYPHILVNGGFNHENIINKVRKRIQSDRYKIRFHNSDSFKVRNSKLGNRLNFTGGPHDEAIITYNQVLEIAKLIRQPLAPEFTPIIPDQREWSQVSTRITGYLKKVSSVVRLYTELKDALTVLREEEAMHHEQDINMLTQLFSTMGDEQRRAYLDRYDPDREALRHLQQPESDCYRQWGEYLLTKAHLHIMKKSLRQPSFISPVYYETDSIDADTLPLGYVNSVQFIQRNGNEPVNVLSIKSYGSSEKVTMHVSTLNPDFLEAQQMVAERIGIKLF